MQLPQFYFKDRLLKAIWKNEQKKKYAQYIQDYSFWCQWPKDTHPHMGDTFGNFIKKLLPNHLTYYFMFYEMFGGKKKQISSLFVPLGKKQKSVNILTKISIELNMEDKIIQVLEK